MILFFLFISIMFFFFFLNVPNVTNLWFAKVDRTMKAFGPNLIYYWLLVHLFLLLICMLFKTRKCHLTGHSLAITMHMKSHEPSLHTHQDSAVLFVTSAFQVHFLFQAQFESLAHRLLNALYETVGTERRINATSFCTPFCHVLRYPVNSYTSPLQGLKILKKKKNIHIMRSHNVMIRGQLWFCCVCVYELSHLLKFPFSLLLSFSLSLGTKVRWEMSRWHHCWIFTLDFRITGTWKYFPKRESV